MHKSVARWLKRCSQWFKVGGCALVAVWCQPDSPSVESGLSELVRVSGWGGANSDIDRPSLDEPLLASLVGSARGPHWSAEPEACLDGDCGRDDAACWDTPRGRICRDASLCEGEHCRGPGYPPPVVRRHRAELKVPAGFTVRDAWLVLEDAEATQTERPLMQGFCRAASVKREHRSSIERLEFDVPLVRPGVNRFQVRADVVSGALTRRIETPLEQVDYRVPAALGHVGRGTFRLPLLHFPRTISACRPGQCSDRDGDGLSDLWENVAAQQLGPRLMMDESDGLFERPRDSVRVFTSVVPIARRSERYLLFANVVAFSRDYGVLGFFGHPGDTEAAGLLYRIDANETLHWVASLTKGHPCFFCKPSYRFGKQEFASDGTPLIFVEKNKHGLWPSERSCRDQAGFHCGRRSLRPAAVNVGNAARGVAHALVDSLDHLEAEGPFGALARVFPGEAIWSPGRAAVRGRFCGGQRGCSRDHSANQPGAVIADMVEMFEQASF